MTPFNQDWLNDQLKKPVHRIIGEFSTKPLSPCCQSAIVVHREREGTQCYVCLACGKPVPDSASPVGAKGAKAAEIPPESPVATGGAAVKRGGGTRVSVGPTKTEQRYYDEVLASRLAGGLYRRIVFHGLRLYMANGHIYTPDWCCVRATGLIELHEVKGSYRLHSYQRSRLAFDQARVEWPEFMWVWAEKTFDGWKNNWKP